MSLHRSGPGGRLPLAGRSHPSEPQQRQVVVLAVDGVWCPAYEPYAHSAAVRTAGLPAGTVLTAAEQAAWRFTRQLTAYRRVDQPIYGRSRAAGPGLPGRTCTMEHA